MKTEEQLQEMKDRILSNRDKQEPIICFVALAQPLINDLCAIIIKQHDDIQNLQKQITEANIKRIQ